MSAPVDVVELVAAWVAVQAPTDPPVRPERRRPPLRLVAAREALAGAWRVEGDRLG